MSEEERGGCLWILLHVEAALLNLEECHRCSSDFAAALAVECLGMSAISVTVVSHEVKKIIQISAL